MTRALLVVVGGGVGSLLRYLTTLAAVRLFSADLPAGTLAVNLTGCFLIGFFHTFALLTSRVSPEARLFLTTGVMGGLTTYSSFNYETLELFGRGRSLHGVVYAITMIAGCAVAGVLGTSTAKALTSAP